MIEPMLAWLSAAASRAGGVVLSLAQWRELFDSATQVDTVTPVLRGIAAMAEQWVAERATASAIDGLRRVLLQTVSVTVTGDLAERTVDQVALTDRRGEDIAAALVDLGVLVPTTTLLAPASISTSASASGRVNVADDAESPGGVLGWRLVDLRLIGFWPRLHEWVSQAQRALTVRSGLEHDARWWEQSGHPPAWLYSHVRLAVVADALVELAPEPTDNSTAGAVDVFRFGAASAGQVPPAALRFWTAAQTAAQVRLRMDQIIMGLIIVLIAMVLGLGVTLAVVTGIR